MQGLMLHSGSAAVDESQVRAVPTPEATESWRPVPHHRVLDLARSEIEALGFRVTDAAHGLWNNGLRYFGLLELANGGAAADYSLVAGIRNSHDKSFPAALSIGSRVFVCDNLAFSGEIVISRRHTTYIERDLPGLVGRAVARLVEQRELQGKRIDAYKALQFVEERDVHDFVIRAVDERVIPNARIADVLGQWRKPAHEAFAPRTAWSLFNAFTESLKGIAEYELARRTTKLHGMLDARAGLLTAGNLVGDAVDADVRVAA
jgi:hypothetical protein